MAEYSFFKLVEYKRARIASHSLFHKHMTHLEISNNKHMTHLEISNKYTF